MYALCVHTAHVLYRGRMSLEEEQGTSGIRKVHAFVLDSNAVIWDAHGRQFAWYSLVRYGANVYVKLHNFDTLQTWHI